MEDGRSLLATEACTLVDLIDDLRLEARVDVVVDVAVRILNS